MDKYVIMLEDDKDDRSLVKETLSELSIDIPIRFFANSSDLYYFLSHSPKPSLILVDHNSVPDDGLEVLKKLKGSSEYNTIPVVILSESDFASYKNECYRQGASSFIKKPNTLERTRQKIGTFFKYWFDVAEV